MAVIRGREKSAMFTCDERVALFAEATQDIQNVRVEHFNELTVEFRAQARRRGDRSRHPRRFGLRGGVSTWPS